MSHTQNRCTCYQQQVTIPVLMLPRRAGEEVTRTLDSNGSATLSLASAVQPKYSYSNLAAYSSQGPTQRDLRIKPDILAVGSTISAAVPGSLDRPVESFSVTCAAEYVVCCVLLVVGYVDFLLGGGARACLHRR